MEESIEHMPITRIAQRCGLSENEVEKCLESFEDNDILKILRSYQTVNIHTGKVERFKVVKLLYLFYHPGEIEMRS